MPNFLTLRRQQFLKVTRRIKNLPPVPIRGWIHAVREALGMTVTQFAKRMGIPQPNASRLEKLEVQKTTSIETLSRAAEALGCRFVYAFVPKTSIEEFIKKAAYEKAAKLLTDVSHSMTLEDQKISRTELNEQIRDLAEEMIRTNDKRIWE